MKITKTKSGRFTAVVHIGTDPAGRQIKKRFTADSRTQLKLDVSTYVSVHRIYTESHAFADALKRYIDAREGHRSPSTIRGYRNIERPLTERYAAFCSLRTDRITTEDVQEIINDMRDRDLSVKTMKNWIGLINAVLKSEKQPTVSPLIPASVICDREIPTQGEIKMMLCLMHNKKIEVPFQLALLGLRRSEICALTLDDLSDDDILHIHRSKVLEDGGASVIKDTPKTDTSNRYIQIPHHLAKQIRRQGYVTKYTLNGLSHAYDRFLTRYRFPHYRLHDCRHFFASYCHERGVPEADILAGGGWKTAHIMKRTYRHALAKNRASAEIGALLEG